MEIKVLGSAAAEGCPSLWCECAFCQQIRETGGKDIRRRTSYLIDDDTLVDFGPDFFWQSQSFGVDERKLERLIITHPHEDHLNPIDLTWRRTGFSKVSKQIHVLGGHRIFTRIMDVAGNLGAAYDLNGLSLIPVRLDHGKYTEDGDIGILPLNATHAPGMTPYVYVISRGGRKVFICNDTGFLPEESLQAIAGQQMDLMFIDCTMGFGSPDCAWGHMGVNTVVALRDKLLENGALKPEASVYANHFSHNGRPLQRELEAFFAPKNIKVAYDGLTLNV